LDRKFWFRDLNTSPMGLGAWQIGDKLFWSYGKTHQYQDSLDALRQSLFYGVNFIDTAEVYGFGRSESILGEFLGEIDQRPVITTKYFPYPWRFSNQSLLSALKNSLQRLNLDYIDIYQIHWPSLPFIMRTWAEGLTEIVRMGFARYVGVSNFNHNQVKKMYALLQENKIPLISNQLEYNLLNRKIEKNGLMDLCNELGITIIAYSPLAQGFLTGKYNHVRPKSAFRRYRYGNLNQEKLRILVDMMLQIGDNYGGKTPAQVAINWLMCKGVVPIPGSKTGKQAKENAGALGWKLNKEDVNKLDDISDKLRANDLY
jgi:aryl-alcohol dehydrogenase-like predicted oxidoreductase